MKTKLRQALDLYLETRRSFGFALDKDEVELGGFIRYANEVGHTGPLTSSLAIKWACQPEDSQPTYWAMRLGMVRRFTQFWQAYEPRTEVASPDLFGPRATRRAVHVFSQQEFAALLDAASLLGRRHLLRQWTFCTLVALLYCTGLRIGEALGLCDSDIAWADGVLTIRRAKHGHARIIPVQPSTVRALTRYRSLRDKTLSQRSFPRFFVGFAGRPLGYFGISGCFRTLCQHLGWTQPPVPRLHDLRHTFAVRTLLHWYRTGQPVGPKLWTLSTYLGHRHLADTYWYLTAVPELMQLCQQRFASAQTWASQGIEHD